MKLTLHTLDGSAVVITAFQTGTGIYVETEHGAAILSATELAHIARQQQVENAAMSDMVG